MTHTDAHQQKRLIYKVLVLSNNPALQGGYLNQVPGINMTYQLYSSMGIGIGVTRVTKETGNQIVMQLWSMPADGRYPTVIKQLSKGHSSAIVIIDENEIDELANVAQIVSEVAQEIMMIVVIGSYDSALRVAQWVEQVTDRQPRVANVESIFETITQLGYELDSSFNGDTTSSLVFAIDPVQCPQYIPAPDSPKIQLSTDEEVKIIRDIVKATRAKVTKDRVLFFINEGKIEISIRSGKVDFSPLICSICRETCVRKSNLCIVGLTEGWSTYELGERALLTLAKIEALLKRELPEHIERQIKYASSCSSFVLDSDDEQTDEILAFLAEVGLKPKKSRWSLLEEARSRLSDNRLTESAYNLLRKHLSDNHDTQV
ncbi:MAG: hypothetical protein ACTSV2_01950 [Candidatus Thorarchaeota archaeon]